MAERKSDGEQEQGKDKERKRDSQACEGRNGKLAEKEGEKRDKTPETKRRKRKRGRSADVPDVKCDDDEEYRHGRRYLNRKTKNQRSPKERGPGRNKKRCKD